MPKACSFIIHANKYINKYVLYNNPGNFIHTKNYYCNYQLNNSSLDNFDR